MQTVFKNIQESDVIKEPFPHLTFRNAIDAELCDQLLHSFPSLETLSRGYPLDSNRRFSLPAADALEDTRVSELWKKFIRLNTSQQYLDDAMRIFRPSILAQYPDFEERFGPIGKLRAGIRGIDTFDTADVLIDAQPSVNTPTFRPSAVRGPHLDNPNKLFFGLFYMRHPEDKSEGGELIFYKYKEGANKNIYSYKNNGDVSQLEEVKRLPYERNTLFITLGVPDAIHGVSPRGPARHPRYFVNILAEINGQLFEVPYEDVSKKIARRMRSMTTVEKGDKSADTIMNYGFYHRDRDSVLVLNPQYSEAAMPEIYESHNVLYKEDILFLDKEERARVVGLITGKNGVPLTEKIFEDFPNIRVVGIASGSLKKFAPEIALRRGLPIFNVSKTYADAVAELTLMHAISGIRNAFRSHDRVRQGSWGTFETAASKAQARIKQSHKIIEQIFGKNTIARVSKTSATIFFNGIKKIMSLRNDDRDSWVRGEWNEVRRTYNASRKTLDGASIGIVGYGHVSRRLIELLQPFNCDIAIHSDHLSVSEAEALGARKASLLEVCTADVVTIHRGLSKGTEGSFGKKEIDTLKRGAVLINTSRGSIIDEKALVKRLRKGDVTACLDVYEEEPLPKSHPFRRFPNVSLTSHIGNLSDRVYKKAIVDLGAVVAQYLRTGESAEKAIYEETQVEQMT